MEIVVIALALLLALESFYLVRTTRPQGVEATLRVASKLVNSVSAEAAARDLNTRRVSKIVSDINTLVTDCEQN